MRHAAFLLSIGAPPWRAEERGGARQNHMLRRTTGEAIGRMPVCESPMKSLAISNVRVRYNAGAYSAKDIVWLKRKKR
jgi:hypothetical protein